MLERTTRVNLLYDFYGPLLSDKQQSFLELYYHDDWSLREIADKYQLSRQGVFDIIKRSENSLEEFESKLGLLSKHLNKITVYEDIINLIDTSSIPSNDKDKLLSLVQNLQTSD